MAYDKHLAERLRQTLENTAGVSERKMFGGIAFMVNGNMCCGVIDDLLMARVGPDAYEKALAEPHTRAMDFTGKPMKGYVYVEPDGYKSDEDLKRCVKRCVDFVLTLKRK